MHRDWLVVELCREVKRPKELVCRERADADFHARVRVHPDIRTTVLAREDGRVLLLQEARVAGIVQRDEFLQTVLDDGTVVRECVSGPNRGGRIVFTHDALGPGVARIRARLEVPVAGFKRLLKPLLKGEILKAARKALSEACAVLETGRYEAYLATLQIKSPVNILVTE